VLRAPSLVATSNNRIILILSAPNSANTPNLVRVLQWWRHRISLPSGTVTAPGHHFTDNNAGGRGRHLRVLRLDSLTAAPPPCSATSGHPCAPDGHQSDASAPAAATAAPPRLNVMASRWPNTAFSGALMAARRCWLSTTASAPGKQATVVNGEPGPLPAQASGGVTSGGGCEHGHRAAAVQIPTTRRAWTLSSPRTYNVITPNRDGQNDVLVQDQRSCIQHVQWCSTVSQRCTAPPTTRTTGAATTKPRP
jgi:hypothetical protein